MIGASHHRLGGDRLAAGAGRFVADVRVPGMLHAAVLRSRHAHARLVSDRRQAGARAAGRARGAHGRRRARRRHHPEPRGSAPGTERYLQPAIARGVVRYVGEPVALVVADDRYVAEDALALIDVVYDPLPGLRDRRPRRWRPARPLLFPGTESNNVAVITMRVGDVDAALAGAAVVIRERFVYPRQTAAALETRGLVAVPPDPTGGELHLIGSTKCIHINRGILAPIFGIPLGALRLTEVDVGGGFGVRGELYPEDILVPLAAMKLGRPVQWIEERRESLMATNHARQVEYEVEMGFDGDGRILGLRALIHADIGAYVRTAALVPAEFGAALFPGPYRVPSYRVRSLVGGHQQDAGGDAPLARASRVQLRPRAPDGSGRRAPRPRPGRDQAAQPDPRRRDALRLRHQVVRRQHRLRLGRLPRALRRAAAPPGLRSRARGAGGAQRAARGCGAASGSPSTSRRPDSAPSRPPMSRRGPTDASPSTPAPRPWGPGSRPCSRRSWARLWAWPPIASTCATPTRPSVESGVGTYGSRGTVTAGNAAAMAAAKLIAEARSRAAAAWGVPEAEVDVRRRACSRRPAGA